jgi:hypothetical protein
MVVGKAKVKTHHRRPDLKHSLEMRLVECRGRYDGIGDFAEAEFAVIGRQEFSDVGGTLWIIARFLVDKKVGVVWPSGAIAYQFAVSMHSLDTVHRKAQRTQSPGT